MTHPEVVVDAGPLIALAGVGQLSVLDRLYGRILVPSAVIREVTLAGAARRGAGEVSAAGFIEEVNVSPPPDPLLANELGPGEAEVITLA